MMALTSRETPRSTAIQFPAAAFDVCENVVTSPSKAFEHGKLTTLYSDDCAHGMPFDTGDCRNEDEVLWDEKVVGAQDMQERSLVLVAALA
jgi:hypothetical protein